MARYLVVTEDQLLMVQCNRCRGTGLGTELAHHSSAYKYKTTCEHCGYVEMRVLRRAPCVTLEGRGDG